MIGWLLWQGLGSRLKQYYYIMLFAIGSMAFFYSADYVLNNVMEPHQRVRINVLLGLEEDLAGAGYNVHQSEIAIGSGGLEGKGFLNGTQTKLKFVPEQDTDFIFCTVGEEQGFFINVGMVLGLTPVIGIPLPFFSYGGSSLWGFTLLLFIFLRIDASRKLVRS